MNDDLLGQIISLEKQLQEQLGQEKARAAGWLARELGSLDQALAAAEQSVSSLDRATLERAREAVQDEGKTLLEEINRQCTQLAALDENFLKQVLAEHLQAIFPETGHDHPNGQS